MKTNRIFALVVPISFIMFSCETYYYVPTMQNVSLFKEKNELHASYGGDEYNLSCFQGSYSITDHVGTHITYMSSSDHNDYLLEGGMGYYLRYEKYLAFEAFGGYGHGMVEGYNMNRLYIQPTMGFVSDFLDIVFTPRFTKVNYKSNIEGYFLQPYPYKNEINNIDKQSYYFFEPGVTIRLGYKYVKLQYQSIQANKLNSAALKYLNTNTSLSVLIILPLK